MTYRDGVADNDIGALQAFHREEEHLATVTTVRPPGRFSRLDLQGQRALGFQEKPRGDGDSINGGFFVHSPAARDRIDGEDTLRGNEPMRHLVALRHKGSWLLPALERRPGPAPHAGPISGLVRP